MYLAGAGIPGSAGVERTKENSAFVTRALMGHFSSEAGSADVFPTPQPASSLGAGGRGGAACLIFRVRTRSEDHGHLGVGGWSAQVVSRQTVQGSWVHSAHGETGVGERHRQVQCL